MLVPPRPISPDTKRSGSEICSEVDLFTAARCEKGGGGVGVVERCRRKGDMSVLENCLGSVIGSVSEGPRKCLGSVSAVRRTLPTR